jgi:calcium-dependent protein kinase
MRTYESFQDELWYYIVTDLIEGCELFTALEKRGKFDEYSTAVIIKQILKATAYCHGKNLVHRDLKPENLIYNEKDGKTHITVIDFGTSAFFDNYKKLTSTIGSPYYIAPEVLAGKYDEKCDIWSIGVILYML